MHVWRISLWEDEIFYKKIKKSLLKISQYKIICYLCTDFVVLEYVPHYAKYVRMVTREHTTRDLDRGESKN